MEVGAEDVAINRSFAVVLAVVAEPCDHTAQRLDAIAQVRPAAVIFEADERLTTPLDDDVADEAPGVPARVGCPQIQDSAARQLFSRGGAVETTHQLVASADGKEHNVAFHGLLERLAL